MTPFSARRSGCPLSPAVSRVRSSITHVWTPYASANRPPSSPSTSGHFSQEINRQGVMTAPSLGHRRLHLPLALLADHPQLLLIHVRFNVMDGRLIAFHEDFVHLAFDQFRVFVITKEAFGFE